MGQALTDPVAAFLDHMRSVGCDPHDASAVIADDKRRRYRLADDKPKTLNGCYQLRVEGDGFAFGWCKNWREGQTHSWHVKTARKASAEEKAAWKAKAVLARQEEIAGTSRGKHRREQQADGEDLWIHGTRRVPGQMKVSERLRTPGRRKPAIGAGAPGYAGAADYLFFLPLADEKGNFTRSRRPPAGEKFRMSRRTPAMSASTTSCSFASPSSCTAARRCRE